MNRRLHLELNRTRVSDDGNHSFELGLKVGYWPCLRGPFVCVALGFRRIDFWFGLPSYWKKGIPNQFIEGLKVPDPPSDGLYQWWDPKGKPECTCGSFAFLGFEHSPYCPVAKS